MGLINICVTTRTFFVARTPDRYSLSGFQEYDTLLSSRHCAVKQTLDVIAYVGEGWNGNMRVLYASLGLGAGSVVVRKVVMASPFMGVMVQRETDASPVITDTLVKLHVWWVLGREAHGL